jgi:hypothetical protein
VLGSSPWEVLDNNDHQMMVCGGKASAWNFGVGARTFQGTKSARSDSNGWASSSSCAASAWSKKGCSAPTR